MEYQWSILNSWLLEVLNVRNFIYELNGVVCFLLPFPILFMPYNLKICKHARFRRKFYFFFLSFKIETLYLVMSIWLEIAQDKISGPGLAQSLKIVFWPGQAQAKVKSTTWIWPSIKLKVWPGPDSTHKKKLSAQPDLL